jgi:hypothetical protein
MGRSHGAVQPVRSGRSHNPPKGKRDREGAVARHGEAPAKLDKTFGSERCRKTGEMPVLPDPIRHSRNLGSSLQKQRPKAAPESPVPVSDLADEKAVLKVVLRLDTRAPADSILP